MFLQAHCPSTWLHVAEEFTVPNNEQPQAMINKYWAKVYGVSLSIPKCTTVMSKSLIKICCEFLRDTHEKHQYVGAKN